MLSRLALECVSLLRLAPAGDESKLRLAFCLLLLMFVASKALLSSSGVVVGGEVVEFGKVFADCRWCSNGSQEILESSPSSSSSSSSSSDSSKSSSSESSSDISKLPLEPSASFMLPNPEAWPMADDDRLFSDLDPIAEEDLAEATGQPETLLCELRFLFLCPEPLQPGVGHLRAFS